MGVLGIKLRSSSLVSGTFTGLLANLLVLTPRLFKKIYISQGKKKRARYKIREYSPRTGDIEGLQNT